MLLAAGADRTIENIKNETAAVWARRHGNVELAFFIEEFGLEAEAESSSRELVAAAAEEAARSPPDTTRSPGCNYRGWRAAPCAGAAPPRRRGSGTPYLFAPGEAPRTSDYY